jgi:uncharacterized protein (TIGR03435 family)
MSVSRKLLVHSAACIAIASLAGQSVDTPDWQAAAGGKRAFEVASIKMDKGPFRPPNFALDTGDAFTPTPGNRFSADFPLLSYIQFAYKVNFSQQQREFILAHWPKWIDSDRYAIEARAAGPANKDQMRLMMQTLLSDRFRLAVHFETQETAVMALRLVKPGKTGPKLRAHSEGPACEDVAAPVPQGRTGDSSGPFPARCYVQELYGNGHQLRAGSRNTTMDELAGVLSGLGHLDRPVVDQTGLSSRIDYEMEWTRESNPAGPADANSLPDQGPTFLEALREQLGLKLESTKAPLRVLVIDHVERPAEN